MREADFQKLPELIGAMEEFVGRLGLDEPAADRLLAHVRTIKSQMFLPSSDPQVVGGSLRAIRAILDAAGEGQLPSAFRKEIDSILD